MRGRLWSAVALTGATIVSCVVLPSEWERTTSVAVLVLAVAAALRAVVALSQPLGTTPRERAVDDEPPVQLRAIARAVSAAENSPRELSRQLRPYLRDIAAHRLARRGLALDRSRGAHELLGDDLHDLLVLDVGPRAVDREGGLSRARLRAALDRLEDV